MSAKDILESIGSFFKWLGSHIEHSDTDVGSVDSQRGCLDGYSSCFGAVVCFFVFLPFFILIWWVLFFFPRTLLGYVTWTHQMRIKKEGRRKSHTTAQNRKSNHPDTLSWESTLPTSVSECSMWDPSHLKKDPMDSKISLALIPHLSLFPVACQVEERTDTRDVVSPVCESCVLFIPSRRGLLPVGSTLEGILVLYLGRDPRSLSKGKKCPETNCLLMRKQAVRVCVCASYCQQRYVSLTLLHLLSLSFIYCHSPSSTVHNNCCCSLLAREREDGFIWRFIVILKLALAGDSFVHSLILPLISSLFSFSLSPLFRYSSFGTKGNEKWSSGKKWERNSVAANTCLWFTWWTRREEKQWASEWRKRLSFFSCSLFRSFFLFLSPLLSLWLLHLLWRERNFIIDKKIIIMTPGFSEDSSSSTASSSGPLL